VNVPAILKEDPWEVNVPAILKEDPWEVNVPAILKEDPWEVNVLESFSRTTININSRVSSSLPLTLFIFVLLCLFIHVIF
jgi:hypothetical protein